MNLLDAIEKHAMNLLKHRAAHALMRYSTAQRYNDPTSPKFEEIIEAAAAEYVEAQAQYVLFLIKAQALKGKGKQ